MGNMGSLLLVSEMLVHGLFRGIVLYERVLSMIETFVCDLY
jgi:hypothetical protein